ncbi:MAG: cyanophycinase [Acidobacteria bacterium]|nr:cyanophycinase [Acidobacteriota bacterium]
MRWLVAALLAAFVSAQAASGPGQGSLVVIGGGQVGDAILKSFIELAGGKDSPLVVIPTAGEADTYSQDWQGAAFLRRAGCAQVSILHTRDRKVADSPEFAEMLRSARGVFFTGGRQWRLVDAYMNTAVQRELEGVLERGGVIAGSSAGASIQASYLVRGAREGNQIMMAPGYEQGFGYLRDTAVDQHLLRRGRQNDLTAVVLKHPNLLGIGIDESTAIVVRGNQFEVVGTSKVAIYEHGRPFYFLDPGERFDLERRRKLQ